MWPLEIVEEIGSTQDELKRRAEAGAEECALLARRQVSGRGTHGRRWATIEGNLHLSVLLRPGPFQPGHWSLLAGVALADAVAPLASGRGTLRLKWPNDLVLDGGKLAGILLDASPGAWVVMGFGVNLAAAPSILDRATAALDGTEAPHTFGARLLKRLADWRALYDRAGFGPVRNAWLARGPRPGEALEPGRFAGIGDDGRLLLAEGGHVVAGTVGP